MAPITIEKSINTFFLLLGNNLVKVYTYAVNPFHYEKGPTKMSMEETKR